MNLLDFHVLTKVLEFNVVVMGGHIRPINVVYKHDPSKIELS